MRILATIAALLLSAAIQAQIVNVCDRSPGVREAIFDEAGTDDCEAVDSKRVKRLSFVSDSRAFTSSREGDFKGLGSLEELHIIRCGLTWLPEGWFDDLTSLRTLNLRWNRLTELPAGVFDELDNLQRLYLHENWLSALPAGVFDELDNLHGLWLYKNRLTSLPAGVFDGLDSLEGLYLNENRLTSLPAGVFDELDNLQHLYLNENWLSALPAGVFDELDNLQRLYLHGNHLVGLTRDDRVFAGFSSDVDIRLHDQTNPPDQTVNPPPPPTPATRTNAAAPLMLSASTSGRQGFVRIVNEGGESGIVRVFAVDDGGNAHDPIELTLGAKQTVHFNADDLENGNANKGIEGVGTPVEGDWRLDVATTLPVRVLSFVRHADGFLTAMHDVLPRTDDGRLAAHIFNPGRNLNQASRLRLANTGADDADVSIEGVDDGGNTAGPVTLTLEAGESRTFSAVELESGARGLSGTLGAGAGKWRLFIEAGSSVVGMSLLESANGNLTNISTSGVAAGD